MKDPKQLINTQRLNTHRRVDNDVYITFTRIVNLKRLLG